MGITRDVALGGRHPLSGAEVGAVAGNSWLRVAWWWRVPASLGDALLAERERWPVWLPVLIGVGIALYFVLPAEPPHGLALAATAISGVVAVAMRGRRGAPVAWACLACAVGFGAAVWRAERVAAPILAYRIGPLPIEGRVITVTDRAEGGATLILDRVRLVRRHPVPVPERVRLRVRADRPTPAVGERVRLVGVLMPPPAPAAPGAYDFGRAAWFARIGAVGYAMGAPTTIAAPPGGRLEGVSVWLTGIRHELSLRIRAALDAPAGPVAADLLTGDDSGVDDATYVALRNAGLGHLLSISGLHMAMVAGILFFLIRGGLALAPRIALRYPIKKWAAVAALIGAFCYLLLSGASYPAQRSFLMTAIGLGALMIDRSPISMRVLAVAAIVLLLATPEALLNVSFQLSFAAVAALIALYEGAGSRLVPDRTFGIPQRALLWLAASLASGLACELALAPIAAYQFNRVTLFGAAANLVAIPLFGFWIMPAGVLALVLLPFGMAAPVLAAMGFGIDVLLALAHWVASWPHAVLPVPAIPAAAFTLIMLGEVWLLLWRRRWRWLGLGVMAGGALLTMLARPPDILVARDGRLVAVRGADGALAFSSLRRGAFTRDLWLRRDGAVETGGRPAVPDAAACTAGTCLFTARNGVTVAYLPQRPPATTACPKAAILVAADTAGPCKAGPLTIDHADLLRNGAYALWLDRDRIRVVTVREARGDRPWSRNAQPYWPRAVGRRGWNAVANDQE
jgi:competence protein ComEC